MFQQILQICQQKQFFDLTSKQDNFDIEIRLQSYYMMFDKKSYLVRIVGKYLYDKNKFCWMHHENNIPKHVKKQSKCLYDFGKIHKDNTFTAKSIKNNPDDILKVCCYLFKSEYYFHIPYEINVYGTVISSIYFVVDDNNFKPYLL